MRDIGNQSLGVFRISFALSEFCVELSAGGLDLLFEPADCNLFSYCRKFGAAVWLQKLVLVAERSIRVGVCPVECNDVLLAVND